MDDSKSHFPGLFDVGERIVDEQTFRCGSAYPPERDLIDFGMWFDLPDLAGENNVVQ